MSITTKQKFFLLIIAVIFTIGLTFASLELPRLLNSYFVEKVNTPGFDHNLTEVNMGKTELFIEYYNLRTIGYICLSLLITLIIIGFITNKTSLSSIGAFTLFLPVFGHFAINMFFLAGLGMLRAIWFPFFDLSFDLLSLGDIAYLPCWILNYFASFFGIDITLPLAYLLMGTGMFVFTFGTIAWFFTKIQSKGTVDIFLYKISRHPQYLGWILWSYGFLLWLIPNTANFKLTYQVPSSLPWLISTMIIIGISMVEELKMKSEYGEEYENYREKTPFMFPLPKLILKVFSFPFKKIFRKDYPTRKREIATVLSIYTLVFILLSAVIPILESPEKIFVDTGKITELATTLADSEHRRTKSKASIELSQMGEKAVMPLCELLKHEDKITREFSAWAIGEIGSNKAIKYLLEALNDKEDDVLYRIIEALGKLDAEETIPQLILFLDHKSGGVKRSAASALARLNAKEAVDQLIQGLNDPDRWVKISFLMALAKIGSEKAIEPIINLLKDKDNEVKKAAIVSLSKYGSDNAVKALQKLRDDSDWEIRIYAEEAINKIAD